MEAVGALLLILGYMVSTSVHRTFAVWIFFVAALLIVGGAPLSKIASILLILMALSVACWLTLDSARNVVPPLEPVLQTASTALSKGRPYIVISDSNLEPLNIKKLVLTFVIENTGSVELKGYFKDVTCRFSYFVNQRYLRYITGTQYTFTLAPREKNTMRFEFSGSILDDDKIKMLTEKTAELYVIARGEYWDESGNKYPLPYCRRYDTSFANNQNVVFCDDHMTFTEPTYNDQ